MDTTTQHTQTLTTKIADNGLFMHTFTMGEVLIAVELLIIILILLANMKNWSRKD